MARKSRYRDSIVAHPFWVLDEGICLRPMICDSSVAGRSRMDFTVEQARETTKEPAAPVADFPIKYIWHSGPWKAIFDKQIALIQLDIRRAKAEDKLVIYLSCPISSRGGGYSGTNVDVAKFIERSLLARWGEAFWILNPAQYQLESKAGTGLMDLHAKDLGIDLQQLSQADQPTGGDYMRMWTTVLVSNDKQVGERVIPDSLRDTGQFFDAFYFIGPRDVQAFFLNEGTTLTAGIQAYFARKYATDADFRVAFNNSGPDWRDLGPRGEGNEAAYEARDRWVLQRNGFLRFYGLKASANFSLGSHDEWLIYQRLNERRRAATRSADQFMVDGDVSEQIAGFFDGGQINPASSEIGVSRGYSV